MQLVIDKYGSHLGIKDGMFWVKHDDGSKTFPVTGVHSILVTRTSSITTGAVRLALENDIEIVFIDRKGSPYGRIWSNKFGSISTIRKNQVSFAAGEEALDWIKELVLSKFDNQESLLFSLKRMDGSTDREIEKSISKIDRYRKKLKVLTGSTVQEAASTIRGLEGSTSRCYFDCINYHLPDQYKFEKRSMHPATDMFNAMLNYAYGMLYSKVESALILAGLDPYLGVFHRDEYNRPVLTYDIIEKFRVWADFPVINLMMEQVIFKEFFITEKGACYLDTPAKRILIHSINDYLAEVIKINGIERSRENHIHLYAQKFAARLKNWKSGH